MGSAAHPPCLKSFDVQPVLGCCVHRPRLSRLSFRRKDPFGAGFRSHHVSYHPNHPFQPLTQKYLLSPCLPVENRIPGILHHHAEVSPSIPAVIASKSTKFATLQDFVVPSLSNLFSMAVLDWRYTETGDIQGMSGAVSPYPPRTVRLITF